MNIGDNQRTIFLRTYNGDIDIFYEIFWKKIYAISPGIFRSAKVIIDLGSNIGLSALYFLSISKPGRIICIEPDPGNFLMLSKNLSLEINAGKVSILNAAVMQHDGIVQFQTSRMNYNSKVVAEKADAEVASVSMHTLLKMYKLGQVNLLKIDVEGAEEYIFAGDTSWLQYIENIIIEFHQEDNLIIKSALHLAGFSLSRITADKENNNLFLATRT